MKKAIALLLCVFISFGYIVALCTDDRINPAIETCRAYLCEKVKTPSFGTTGGEWAVIGLKRGEVSVSENYYDTYYNEICTYLILHNGILHRVKNTEYSRVIIALTAIGKNPSDVEGYNLLLPLSDYNKTLKQGINGPVWALIALDSGNYDIPDNPDAKIKATREAYVGYILSKQTESGGWSLSGEGTEADITGMALCALSRYRNNEKVNEAIEKGVAALSEIQTDSGGFISNGEENLESTVQTIVALCSLGISAEDERFKKNGNTLFDNLLSFMLPSGGFRHKINDTSENQMATEQAFYALIAAKRFAEGKKSLYDMSDIAKNDNMSYNNGIAPNASIVKSILNMLKDIKVTRYEN